ncbi:transcription antitermination factor NusB [Paracoccus suum]|uniref:Transcription antitermination protein NusB n=1 Tax=Paracoccus suum TaxID=2259340 RepID=A0A344PLW8_9RHOB|nr:transcription antitermination factor NusB [Paracoccus suum]AXC50373.1 transcription antitermination factor NusB [Paracoccus suum]
MSQPDQSERRARIQRRSSAARIYAVQALFQMEAAGQSAERVETEFRHWRIAAPDADGPGIESPEADEELFGRILDDAVTWQARIDQMTDRALVDRWPLDRIDPVLRAVFRAAGAELMAAKAPSRVVISEYMRVAEAFFAEGPEVKLVNAVLDQVARAARPEAFGA